MTDEQHEPIQRRTAKRRVTLVMSILKGNTSIAEATQVRKQSNYAGSRLAPFLMHTMVTEQETPRPLLTPGEVLMLPAEESLILIGGHYPYHARKVFYYKDRAFAGQANLTTPETREAMAREFPPQVRTVWESLPMQPIHQHALPPATSQRDGGSGLGQDVEEHLEQSESNSKADHEQGRELPEWGEEDALLSVHREEDEERVKTEEQRRQMAERLRVQPRRMDIWSDKSMDGPEL
ncbi:MAG: hypothetical protein GKS05_05805 [Nitrospirales bacterium]|nr:hypothetical protein [Nitrospirales bacterium]